MTVMIQNQKLKPQSFKIVILIVILLLGGAINYHLSKPDLPTPNRPLAEFPKIIGDWTMINELKIDEQSMKILQVDDYMMRNYGNAKGDIIGLYIGYFKSQKEGKGIHSPRQCLPGAGWIPVNATVHQMKVPDHQPEIVPVNKFVMGKGLDHQLYLFWYHGRGRIYASEYWNKIYLIWDGLTKRRTDGALVRVNSLVRGNQAEALTLQSEFIQLFFPLLKEFIPD